MESQVIKICCRNFEVTPPIREKIEVGTKKLEGLDQDLVNFNWTCWSSDKKFYSEVSVSGKNYCIHTKADSTNLYKAIDLVVGKTKRKMQKKKELSHERIHHKNDPGLI